MDRGPVVSWCRTLPGPAAPCTTIGPGLRVVGSGPRAQQGREHEGRGRGRDGAHSLHSPAQPRCIPCTARPFLPPPPSKSLPFSLSPLNLQARTAHQQRPTRRQAAVDQPQQLHAPALHGMKRGRKIHNMQRSASGTAPRPLAHTCMYALARTDAPLAAGAPGCWNACFNHVQPRRSKATWLNVRRGLPRAICPSPSTRAHPTHAPVSTGSLGHPPPLIAVNRRRPASARFDSAHARARTNACACASQPTPSQAHALKPWEALEQVRTQPLRVIGYPSPQDPESTCRPPAGPAGPSPHTRVRRREPTPSRAAQRGHPHMHAGKPAHALPSPRPPKPTPSRAKGGSGAGTLHQFSAGTRTYTPAQMQAACPLASRSPALAPAHAHARPRSPLIVPVVEDPRQQEQVCLGHRLGLLEEVAGGPAHAGKRAARRRGLRGGVGRPGEVPLRCVGGRAGVQSATSVQYSQASGRSGAAVVGGLTCAGAGCGPRGGCMAVWGTPTSGGVYQIPRHANRAIQSTATHRPHLKVFLDQTLGTRRP
jgi:hypothetical protein